MLLKLSSSTCSLCEETDVSLSEADTVQYIRFIKDNLENDVKLDNGMQFRICLLCSHSMDLLKEVITRKMNRSVKSCFCCKSTDNLFKQNDLPSNHKTNINSFASIFNLQGRNLCIHCFYVINFWTKLTSFLKSAKQTSDHSKQNSISQSPTKSSKNRKLHLTPSKFNKESSDTFQMPQNINKLPEIKQQAKTIKLLQGKLNRKIVRKYSHDEKLVDRVPFVFVTRIPPSDDVIEIISDDEDVTPRTSSSRKTVTASAVRSKIASIKRNTPTTTKSFIEDSSDSKESDISIPARNFKSRPLRVIISPLKNKQLPSPIKKKDAAKTNISFNKNRRNSPRNKANSDEYAESDENDYSVTSSGSSTGIVIKRISRSNKSKSGKAKKLAASALRTIRIQTKKTNTRSSSESTDFSTTISTPRSPVTLPPKKNRKRIMDLSDTDYYESTPVPEKRSTRAVKDKKRLDKDIEEVIIDDSQEDVHFQDSAKGRGQTRTRSSKKVAIKNIEGRNERDPLEIPSSEDEVGSNNEESLLSTPEKELISKENSAKNDKSNKVSKGGSNKPGIKRLLAKFQDSSEEQSIAEESTQNESENNSNNDDTAASISESDPCIDKLVAKYIDVDKSQSRNSTNASITAEEHDSSKDGEETTAPPENEKTSNDLAAEMDGTQAEQINFETTLISPPENRVIDTLDLLAVLDDDNTIDETPANEAVKQNELNLQLSPDDAMNDTEATVLISNDEDTFGLGTQVATYISDSAGANTKASSQSSNYQDAVDTVAPKENVAELQDNGSQITEEEAGECGSKRKRNAEDSMDSADATDTDETPRTKRVRFAAEKKVLNDDDTVYLEDVGSSEEQKQTNKMQDNAGDTEENEEEVANYSETLCSLDM